VYVAFGRAVRGSGASFEVAGRSRRAPDILNLCMCVRVLVPCARRPVVRTVRRARGVFFSFRQTKRYRQTRGGGSRARCMQAQRRRPLAVMSERASERSGPSSFCRRWVCCRRHGIGRCDVFAGTGNDGCFLQRAILEWSLAVGLVHSCAVGMDTPPVATSPRPLCPALSLAKNKTERPLINVQCEERRKH
jgi:hypothetical protein